MSKAKHDKHKRVKVHIAADLAAALHAGDDLDTVVEAILRAHLGENADAAPDAEKADKSDKFRRFFEDVAGPHLPHFEAVAKDVASRVAKDVAAAAATAAITAWAASAAKPKKPAAPEPKDGGELKPEPPQA